MPLTDSSQDAGQNVSSWSAAAAVDIPDSLAKRFANAFFFIPHILEDERRQKTGVKAATLIDKSISYQ